MTLGAPLYRNSASHHGNLVGVAGVDVETSAFKRKYPLRKLGVFGHAFAINNNGLILFHPKFREQQGYLPDDATLYLHELEYTINKTKRFLLEEYMVNRVTDCFEAELDWLYDNNQRVVRYNATYCFKPLRNTPFITGVCIPTSSQYYVTRSSKYPDRKINLDMLDLSNEREEVEIANWPFCRGKQLNAKYPNLTTIISDIKTLNGTLPSTCNNDLLSDMFLTAEAIIPIARKHWKLANSTNKFNTSFLYFLSSTGLMYTFSDNKYDGRRPSRDYMTEYFYTNPASVNKGLVFYADTEMKKSSPHKNLNTIIISKALHIGNPSVLLDVIGMALPSQYLIILLNSLLHKSFNHTQYDCLHDVDTYCYFLDTHAYIIASNHGDVGSFFGLKNGGIMRSLIKENVYESFEYNDTQSQCVREARLKSTSSSYRLTCVYSSIVTYVNFLLVQLVSLLSYINAGKTRERNRNIPSQTMTNSVEKSYTCSKLNTLYRQKQKYVDYTKTMPCSKQCNRIYTVKTIEETNLLVIITKNNCNNSCLSIHPLRLQPNEWPHKNNCFEYVQYRKPDGTCRHDNETHKSRCSSREKMKNTKLDIYLTIFLTSLGLGIIALPIYCKDYR